MIEEKIKELGFTLPETPKPLAAYVPVVLSDKLVFTAGQVPLQDGKIKFVGKLGLDVSQDDGKKAAEICVLNCLSVVKSAAGSLDNIESIVKLTVFVNSSEDFTAQPAVANGASELLIKIFGEKGKHARSAVGASQLPAGAAVEIEMIAKLK